VDILSCESRAIAEQSSFPTVISTVHAAGSQSDLSFMFKALDGVESSRFGVFAINNSGVISTTGPLDADMSARIPGLNLTMRLVVVVKRPSFTPSECVVNVTIIDVNDNPPVFPQPVVQSSLSENAVTGFTFFTFAATDADSHPFNTITYGLIAGNGTSQFEIRNATLIVAPSARLFAFENQTFSVRVQASDGGLSSAIWVHVRITPVHNFPSFTATPAVTSIVVNVLACPGPLSIPNILFTTNPNALSMRLAPSSLWPSDRFSISTSTSRFQLDTRLDPTIRYPVLSFLVLVQETLSNFSLGSFRINVTITSTNAFAPVFSQPILHLLVPLQNATQVFYVASAIDPDVVNQANRSLEFSFARQSLSPFTIDSQTGVVRGIAGNVTPGNFMLTVIASDNGSPQLSATQTLNITITCSNEPSCVQQFDFGLGIDPAWGAGATVFNTSIYTADFACTYSLTASMNWFIFNSSTGALALGRRVSSNYSIANVSIAAVCAGGVRVNVFLSFAVIPASPSTLSPRFVPAYARLPSVPLLGRSPGIGSVTAVNATGTTGLWFGNIAGLFSLSTQNSTTANILLTSAGQNVSIPWPSPKQSLLVRRQMDAGTTPSVIFSVVEAYLDVQRNIDFSVDAFYVASVSESTPGNTEILRIMTTNARFADRFELSLVCSSASVASRFRLDSNTGRLYTSTNNRFSLLAADFDGALNYSMTVRSTDLWTGAVVSSAAVLVRVVRSRRIDTSLPPLAFESPFYTATIFENDVAGLALRPQPRDFAARFPAGSCGQGLPIVYSIDSIDSGGSPVNASLFSVSMCNASRTPCIVLSANNSLSALVGRRLLINLTATTFSLAFPAQTTVVVAVLDVNTAAPVLLPKDLMYWEDSRPVVIGSLLATDADVDENNRNITFTLINVTDTQSGNLIPNSLFSIDAQSGFVSTTRSTCMPRVQQKEQQIYSITFLVSDNPKAFTAQSCTQRCEQYSFTFGPEPPVGLCIAACASGRRSLSACLLEFSGSIGCRLAHYPLTIVRSAQVTLWDMAISPSFSGLPDNHPRPAIQAAIAINEPVGTPVVTVAVFRPSSDGCGGPFSFSIRNSFFAIENRTGQITVARNLSSLVGSIVAVEVTVIDLSSVADAISSCMVHITVGHPVPVDFFANGAGLPLGFAVRNGTGGGIVQTFGFPIFSTSLRLNATIDYSPGPATSALYSLPLPLPRGPADGTLWGGLILNQEVWIEDATVSVFAWCSAGQFVSGQIARVRLTLPFDHPSNPLLFNAVFNAQGHAFATIIVPDTLFSLLLYDRQAYIELLLDQWDSSTIIGWVTIHSPQPDLGIFSSGASFVPDVQLDLPSSSLIASQTVFVPINALADTLVTFLHLTISASVLLAVYADCPRPYVCTFSSLYRTEITINISYTTSPTTLPALNSSAFFNQAQGLGRINFAVPAFGASVQFDNVSGNYTMVTASGFRKSAPIVFSSRDGVSTQGRAKVYLARGSDIAGLVAIPSQSDVANTAVLTGIPQWFPINVSLVTRDRSLVPAPIALLHCSSNASVISISSNCSQLVLLGNETSGSMGAVVTISSMLLPGLSASFTVRVWYPEALSVRVRDPDARLSAIQGLYGGPACSPVYQTSRIVVRTVFAASATFVSPSVILPNSLFVFRPRNASRGVNVTSSGVLFVQGSGSGASGVHTVDVFGTRGSAVLGSVSVTLSPTSVVSLTSLAAAVLSSLSVGTLDTMAYARYTAGTIFTLAAVELNNFTRPGLMGTLVVHARLSDGSPEFVALSSSDFVSLTSQSPAFTALSAVPKRVRVNAPVSEAFLSAGFATSSAMCPNTSLPTVSLAQGIAVSSSFGALVAIQFDHGLSQITLYSPRGSGASFQLPPSVSAPTLVPINLVYERGTIRAPSFSSISLNFTSSVFSAVMGTGALQLSAVAGISGSGLLTVREETSRVSATISVMTVFPQRVFMRWAPGPLPPYVNAATYSEYWSGNVATISSIAGTDLSQQLEVHCFVELPGLGSVLFTENCRVTSSRPTVINVINVTTSRWAVVHTSGKRGQNTIVNCSLCGMPCESVLTVLLGVQPTTVCWPFRNGRLHR
jgi:hypothetical protein